MSDIGDRMKEYESVSRNRLVRRVPVIIRLDGKAFHTLTADMQRPYDIDFHRCMWDAARDLCNEVHGCQGAYVQSDEISLLVTDWASKDTSAWFDNQVQKMASVAASICTYAFSRTFHIYFPKIYSPKAPSVIAFDARVFNIPPADVCNYFVWRQQDATSNSLNMLAQAHFSHAELMHKSASQKQDMLMLQHGVNWNDCPVYQKRGVFVERRDAQTQANMRKNGASEGDISFWYPNCNIPIFTQDRWYIERFAALPEWMEPFPAPKAPTKTAVTGPKLKDVPVDAIRDTRVWNISHTVQGTVVAIRLAERPDPEINIDFYETLISWDDDDVMHWDLLGLSNFDVVEEGAPYDRSSLRKRSTV